MQIDFGSRLHDSPFLNSYHAIVGNDTPINEPAFFSFEWYSHDHTCAGLRYEVSLRITNADIKWINGRCQYGNHINIHVIRDDLKNRLNLQEYVYTDGIYNVSRCINKQYFNAYNS